MSPTPPRLSRTRCRHAPPAGLAAARAAAGPRRAGRCGGRTSHCGRGSAAGRVRPRARPGRAGACTAGRRRRTWSSPVRTSSLGVLPSGYVNVLAPPTDSSSTLAIRSPADRAGCRLKALLSTIQNWPTVSAALVSTMNLTSSRRDTYSSCATSMGKSRRHFGCSASGRPSGGTVAWSRSRGPSTSALTLNHASPPSEMSSKTSSRMS